MDDLTKRAEEALAAATEGPWQPGEALADAVVNWHLPASHPNAIVCQEATEGDAYFIAEARQLVPDMLARIRELEARLRNTEQNRDMSVRAVHAQTEHIRKLEALVSEAQRVLRPFADLAGEMFARNWNAEDIVTALDNMDASHRVYFSDYLALHTLFARMGGEHDRS